MSQFQFKFDIPSDGGIPSSQAHLAPPHAQKEKDHPSIDEEPKRQFKLMKDITQRLRDRCQVDLEYETIDLTVPREKAAVPPLLQVRSRVDTETESDSLIQEINTRNTDLLPGVYEGGLKVWECSLDLCRYLSVHCDEILSNGGQVLELGCGHGLPACLLLREGLTRNKDISIMFTDYNDFVLHGVALSNISLNTRSLGTTKENLGADVTNHVVLGAGDWMDMSKQLSSGVLQAENPTLRRDGRFDVILAAETTYTAESAKDTAILLARHLKPRSGSGLVACKRYYFGVGGGSDAFREAASSQRILISEEYCSSTSAEYRLSVETLQIYDNGVGNIRELLQIKCVPSLN